MVYPSHLMIPAMVTEILHSQWRGVWIWRAGWFKGFSFQKVFREKLLIKEQLKLFKACKAPCIVFAEVSGSIQGDQNRKLSTRPKMDLDESKNYYKKISEMGKYLEAHSIENEISV